MSDIIKAQQGLARKAQANKAHWFDDLYHLLCKREWIEEALQHVLTNDGSHTPGVDGMSWKDFNDAEKSDFENEQFRQHFIDEVQAELKTRTFQPVPVRRVEIPKPGTNKTRPLGIPTVKDRTVQTLLKMVLEPIWEADFYYFSNGFRPGRCTMDCIQPLYKLGGTRTGYRWVIEGDVRACFDKIPHEHLLKEVARRIADTGILTLIRRFLKSGIMIERTLVQSSAGTPQGGIASPLLANIYLHRFDEWYSQHYGIPDSKEDARASASLATSPLQRQRAGCRADVRATPTTGYWSYAERKRKPRTSKRHVKHFSGKNWGSSSQTRRPRSPTSKMALTS